MRVLVIAAHPDDEILGVGGTILKHKSQGDEVYVCMVTKAYEPEWSKEYMQKKLEEAPEVDRILGVDRRIYCNLPTVKLNMIPHGEFNKAIEDVIEQVDPDVIYTHSEHDLHQDHVLIFTAIMIAIRPKSGKRVKLMCFETISSTEWSNRTFVPNVYVDITDFIEKKIEAFLRYESEVREYPHPRSEEGVRVLAKKRGIEACVEYAEAFVLIRDFW